MKRYAKHAYGLAQAHWKQFVIYLLSGGTAAFTELASFQLMLLAGVHYAIGGPISSGIGIVSAFLLHKYFVFKKRGNTARQSFRYGILTAWNFIAQNAMLVLFVEMLGMHPTLAKILSIGVAVGWNFILYKIFVYA